MNRIHIHNLKLQARLGCTDAERSRPQLISLDVELTMDMSRASISDDLLDTVNYMDVAKLITHMCDSRSWHLVEKMSSDIGMEILERFSSIESVSVALTKFVIPNADGVTCTYTIERGAPSNRAR